MDTISVVQRLTIEVSAEEPMRVLLLHRDGFAIDKHLNR